MIIFGWFYSILILHLVCVHFLQEKKGAAQESGDPFQDIEKLILEEAEKWCKGSFQVTREVYEKDEPLCQSLEQAVWVSVF